MARSVSEIKRTMTDAFMADAVIREKYELKEGDTFSSVFSMVSLENILFFIVASAHYVLERIFEQFKADVSERIEKGVVATIPWYHRMARNYQHGYELHLNEDTFRYEYDTIDEGAQIVRYVAVRDMGGSIQILVSGEKDKRPVPLSNEVLTAFKSYMNAVKIAGVVLSIRSAAADKIQISATIEVDPMVFRTDGTRILDGSRPVEDAIKRYLAGITYGGVFNKTKLVDAIQGVEGVVDVTITDCVAKASNHPDYIRVATNNHTAYAGCYELENENNTISYVV